MAAFGILAVLEHHGVQRQAGHRRDLGEALRQQLMLGVVGDRLGRRIVLQREVQRDAVGGQRDFLRRVGAVVADVVPRRRAGDEGRVQLLQVFQRGDRLLAVDDDVALFVEQRGVVRPQHPVGKAVAVAPRCRARSRPACRPSAASGTGRECRHVVRHLVEADRLQDRLAVDQRAAGGAERQSDPGVALVASCRSAAPAAASRRSACRDSRRRRSARSACRHRCAAHRRSR